MVPSFFKGFVFLRIFSFLWFLINLTWWRGYTIIKRLMMNLNGVECIVTVDGFHLKISQERERVYFLFFGRFSVLYCDFQCANVIFNVIWLIESLVYDLWMIGEFEELWMAWWNVLYIIYSIWKNHFWIVMCQCKYPSKFHQSKELSLPCDFWYYLIKKIYHLRANGIRFNHEKASCGAITRKWRRIFSVFWLIVEIYDVRAIDDEVWRIVWIYF